MVRFADQGTSAAPPVPADLVMERQPPYSPEAELSVLGGMLIDADALGRAVEMVTEEMFYTERHRRLFRAMVRVCGRDEAVDPVTLATELKSAGDFELVGGMQALARLLDAVPTAANISYHCHIVREKATVRRLIEQAQATIQSAYTATDVRTLLDAAEAGIMAVAEQRGRGGFVRMDRLLWPAMERAEQRAAAGKPVTGLSTGFADLDEMTAGFQPGDLVIVAARPSQGKTAFVLGSALHTTITVRRPVAFFSLEMTRDALADRSLIHEARVDGARFRTGRLRDDDYPKLAQAAGLLNGAAPLLIEDSAGISVLEMRAKARRLKREYPDLAAVVVDYLQLLRSGQRTQNRTEEVSLISLGLKALAKELALPVIALSQLSREVERRPDKRPVMADLRESGQLEQDADVIMFLYRPEYYFGPTDKEGNSLEGRAEVIIGKQRNGATGTVHMRFHKECMRFEDAPRHGAAS